MQERVGRGGAEAAELVAARVVREVLDLLPQLLDKARANQVWFLRLSCSRPGMTGVR
jgi:hypothetical protein